MSMRLVRDDEMAGEAERIDPEPLTWDEDSNPDQDPSSQADPEKPASEPAPEPQAEADQPVPASEAEADQPAPAEEAPAAEAQDGPVTDTEDQADESPAEGEEKEQEKAVDLGVLEALLFSTHHPLTPARLAELMELPGTKPLRKAIMELNRQYEEVRRAFRVEQVAGGYQLLTLPEYGEYLNRLHKRDIDTKLTKAALETLAIIAYKQPILRAEVEAIRGVACGETIRSLMEKHLVKIAGRAEEPGRPILYGTTKRFLELFGLNSLKDLPQAEELNKPQG